MIARKQEKKNPRDDALPLPYMCEPSYVIYDGFTERNKKRNMNQETVLSGILTTSALLMGVSLYKTWSFHLHSLKVHEITVDCTT